MRLPTLLLALALLPMPLALAGAGDPGHEDPCSHPREPNGNNCTGVQAGAMSCMPAAGAADMLSSVVGGADQGTFKLYANGTNAPASASGCTFEIRVDPNGIRFNEGWTVGLLGPYGGVTSTSSQPCWTSPGQTCTSTATFTWWRAQHGVTFDVPFELVVNGIVVARGECHYYDPPAGPTLVLTSGSGVGVDS